MGAVAKTNAAQPEWRAFEMAVAALLQALDPKARVRHDVFTPDVDTGAPRQRDVWIDTTFGGHIPFAILVSCKRKKARLSQLDIDAFFGERRASGANVGVLYSHSGFTAPALTKAAKLGISCCMLYVNRAADLPDVLRFDTYCFREQWQLVLTGSTQPIAEVAPALFDQPIDDEGQATVVLSALAKRYDRARDEARANMSLKGLLTWRAGIDVGPLTLGIRSHWGAYRARAEACLLNGSYSFANHNFAGSFSTPWIDQQSTHPGPGWERVELGAINFAGNVIAAFSFSGGIEPAVRAHFASG